MASECGIEIDNHQNVMKIRLDLRPLQENRSLEFTPGQPFCSVTEVMVAVDGENMTIEAKHTLKGVGHTVEKEFTGTYVIPRFIEEKSWNCYFDDSDVFIIETRIVHGIKDPPKFTTRLIINDPRNADVDKLHGSKNRPQHKSCYHYQDSRPKQVAGEGIISIKARDFSPLTEQTFAWSDYEDTRGRDFKNRLKLFREELSRVKQLSKSTCSLTGRAIDYSTETELEKPPRAIRELKSSLTVLTNKANSR